MLFRSPHYFILLFFKDFIYLFMRDTQREAETQAEGEAGSMQGTQQGTRSRDSRVTPWAEGRRSTTELPRCPMGQFLFLELYTASTLLKYNSHTKYILGVRFNEIRFYSFLFFYFYLFMIVTEREREREREREAETQAEGEAGSLR